MLSHAKSQTKIPSSVSRDKALFAALAGFTGLTLAAIAFFALHRLSSSRSFNLDHKGLVKAGRKAPQTTVEEAVGGGQISIPVSGEPTLLVFFATWSPHCRHEASFIADLAQGNKDLNVVMAGADSQDNPEKIRQFLEEYGIEGQAFYEPSVGQTYGIHGYPTHYVIDGSGRVVGANSGEIPGGMLQRWIDKTAV